MRSAQAKPECLRFPDTSDWQSNSIRAAETLQGSNRFLPGSLFHPPVESQIFFNLRQLFQAFAPKDLFPPPTPPPKHSVSRICNLFLFTTQLFITTTFNLDTWHQPFCCIIWKYLFHIELSMIHYLGIQDISHPCSSCVTQVWSYILSNRVSILSTLHWQPHVRVPHCKCRYSNMLTSAIRPQHRVPNTQSNN